jgi:glycosyltransferase involved in cell wall biosynthesis
MAELVEDGRTGLHFQTGDSDSLADAITKLNSDPALHRHMRQQAREEFVSRYTAQRNYQMLLDIYHGVLSRKPDQLRAAA